MSEEIRPACNPFQDHSLEFGRSPEAESRLTLELIALDLKKARLSVNRKRVKPRSDEQALVDRIRSNPNRARYTTCRTRIYFVRSGRYVKIGRSSAGIRGRLVQLQNGNPEPLELIGSYVGIDCDECFIHNLVLEQEGCERGCGEWFILVPTIVRMIAILCGQPYHLVKMEHTRKGGANLGRRRPRKEVFLPTGYTRTKTKPLILN